jgi:DNA-directed RNA polymerase specialized sigma24 family protein
MNDPPWRYPALLHRLPHVGSVADAEDMLQETFIR